MADITMCENKSCPLKDICYRQLAKPSMRQSYSNFVYKIKSDGVSCDYFRYDEIKR
jgi:hypothetical protein